MTPPGGLSVVLCPSIALVAQIRREYLLNSKGSIRALAVCSDETAGYNPKKEDQRNTFEEVTADSSNVSADEIKGKVTTDPEEIARWIGEGQEDERVSVIFGTYQSGHRIAEALRTSETTAEVLICDEAHRTNLGLHSIRNYSTILVSDGSAPLRPTRDNRFTRQFNQRIMRPMETSLEQTRALRRHGIVKQFLSGDKRGALWYTNTDIRKYPIQSSLLVRPEWNKVLASIRTRLNAFTDAEKSRLINRGYILCDLSIRSYYRCEKAPPDGLPFPEFAFSHPPAKTSASACS